MARYAYDVNTTQRYIDVHKQFQGGLKTVDTDDALGAVFLRDAENVSLSEFGFIEKRYGTYENFKIEKQGNLQGYWEFLGYSIYAVNGVLYYYDGTTETTVTTILKEDNTWRYPDTKIADIETNGFQTTRDMNAVNVNNVLYIFTGSYPIYVSVVNEELKFYWFSIDIPSYNEILVTGHNLLEYDYEDVYEFDGSNTTLQNSQGVVDNKFYIKQSNWFPQFPYIEEVANGDTNANTLNIEMSYNRDATISDGGSPYYDLVLDSVSFAPAGSTASDVFTKIDRNSVTTDIINTNDTNVLQIKGYTASDTLTQNEVFGTNTVNFSAEFIRPAHYIIQFKKTGGILTDQETAFTKVYLNRGSGKVELDVEVHEEVGFNFAYFKIPEEYFTEDIQTFSLEIYTSLTYTTDFDDFAIEPRYFVYPRDYALSQSLINVSITNLLAGTWDFRFNFRFYRIFNGIVSYEEVQHSIFDVTITPEKLQDRPGDEDVPIKLHPIWSCNKVIEHFGKLMVWGSEDEINGMPTAVFYSFPDRPTYFPSYFYLDFTNDENKPIIAVSPFMNALIVQTEDRTWGIKGNSGLIDAPAPYVPFSINPAMGTIAYKSVRPVRNKLFFLSKQGIVSLNSLYAVDEMYNVKFEDRNIYNIVPQDSKAVGIQFDNQYWLNFPNYGITLRWYIDKNAWVLDRFGSYTNRLGNPETKVGAWNLFNGVFKWQIVNGKLEFISYPSRFTSENNLALYKIGIDYTLPYDLGEVITSKFQTSFLNQNYPFHPKNYKEFKYDFTIQNEYNPSREPLFNELISIPNNLSYAFPDNIDLKRNHTYMVSFESELGATDIQIDGITIPLTELDLNTSGEITDYKFLTTNDIPEGINALTLIFENATTYSGTISLKDMTYDETLTFKTKLLTEDNQVLNQQLAIGYEEEEADIGIDLEAFGGFTFGTSTFGDRVTLVKTVKLSGKGYNIKSYFEDTSASKWAIESMGITYKMKRARSR